MSKKTLNEDALKRVIKAMASTDFEEDDKPMARGIFPQLGEMFESKCPECGNIDNLTKEETQRTVHCQICYKHYEYEGEKNESIKTIRNAERIRSTHYRRKRTTRTRLAR